MIVWPGLVVGVHLERRVLFGEPAAAPMPSLSWSALVFGSIATEITGSGNVIDSSRIGWLSSHSVSPVVVYLEADRGGDVAREHLVDVLARGSRACAGCGRSAPCGRWTRSARRARLQPA